tara:strand:- start:1603 stop:2127 length:525 start_codon:yes stop_codon:yes gene_type:complete
MAYDQSKLIKDVRICLGNISEEKLPESVIVHFGDMVDSDPEHTGDYPWIFWRTTLSCLDYLKASATTSSESTTKGTKEKVGDVSIDMQYITSKEVISAYDELYNDYASNPEKFGVTLTTVQPPVLINGVSAQEVENYRTNPNTTSTYNPLSAAAFPKATGRSNGRRGFRTGYYS